MAHEVFIGYATPDKKIADAICKILEDKGIPCWIAPRDVPMGRFGGVIVEAVAQSKVMVFIFSAHSNRSANCLTEVHTAFNKGLKIITLRLDDTVPSEDMEYYLQLFHWLDAREPPVEKHLEAMVTRVEKELANIAARAEAERKEKERQKAEAARVQEEAERKRQKAEEARTRKEAKETRVTVKKPIKAKAVWLWLGVTVAILAVIGVALRFTIFTTGQEMPTTTAEDIAKSLQFNSGQAIFDTDRVIGTDALNITIYGQLTCTSNLPTPINDITLVAEIVAKKITADIEVSLNYIYTANSTSPLIMVNDMVEFNKEISLNFPEQAETGDYQVIMRIKEFKVNAGSWLDITEFLPQEYILGIVYFYKPVIDEINYNYIEGYVYDANTGDPISNATVEVLKLTIYEFISPYYEEIISSRQSNSSGYYKTGVIEVSGPFKIRASAEGYETCWYDNTTDIEQATDIYFEPGGETLTITIYLQRLGSINGRVTADADGAGIDNVDVLVYDYATNALIKSVKTNNDGTYRITGLAAGTYRVKAEPSAVSLIYADEYYNNTYDYSMAQPVTVGHGQDVTGIDFSLATGASISGRVVSDADGSGIANANINVNDYNTGQWIRNAITNNEGFYTVTNLPPGTYRLMASPGDNDPYATEYYDDTHDYGMVQAVKVVLGQAVTGIDFSLAPGGRVSGTVRNADGSLPLANVIVECFRIVEGRWESLGGTWTDSQGKYSVNGIPYGQFSMRARVEHNYNINNYVLEYYPEKKTQVEAELLTMSADSNLVDINFTLEVGGSISGRIISETNFEAIPHVRVDVWDYDTGEWLGWAETGADGTYTLHGLPTGRYRIYASTSENQIPFISVYYENTSNSAEAIPIYVTVGYDTPGINFILAPSD